MKAKLIIAAAALAGALGVAAQNTNSGYFLEDYTYNYQLNPAFAVDRNFVSMPALGNLNVAMRGNLHLDNVLYSVDGRTVLFTNPAISAAEALKNIKDRNKVGADVKVNVLSAGFKAWGGFNTISLNARADVAASVPGSFFTLAKEGMSNRTYDISDMSAHAIGYAELALGHSRNITAVPGLRVGGAVKFLVGIAALDADFHTADLTLGRDGWIAQTDADIYANIGGFEYDHKYNKHSDREYVSGANLDGDGSVGPNGFGLGFDLGGEYKWQDFKFSLAFLDLGFISFSDTRHASTCGLQTVNTDEYTFNSNDKAENSFENEWKRLRNNLEDLYQLTDMGNTGSRSRSLHATMNIGVEYEFPLYRKLSFGLLNSTRFAGANTWTEFRMSANVRPVKCFSADANLAVGTYGVGFGWLLNFSTPGFNLFAGMDHTLGKVAKQFVPLNSNASLNFGINFPF